MPPVLDDLFAGLRQQPLDHALDNVAAGVDQQLAERVRLEGQTWRLRAMAAAALVTGGAAVSAATAPAVAVTTSPVAVWSELAPYTLLEASR